jgi:hypothetical protein
MEDMMKRLNRARLIDILFRLSDISIIPMKDKQVQGFNHVYTTEADIVFERGGNCSPQLLCYDIRQSRFRMLTTMKSEEFHLHPYCSLQTITELLENEDICPEDLSRYIRRCKVAGSGYSLALLKCIKFDGVVQGIPVTHLYCSNTEDYGGNNCGSRFDWVELNTNDSLNVYPKIFGQLCAIIELSTPGILPLH